MATTWYHFLVRIRGNQLIYYLFDFILLHTYVRMCAYVCMCTYASLHPFLMMNVASMHFHALHTHAYILITVHIATSKIL